MLKSLVCALTLAVTTVCASASTLAIWKNDDGNWSSTNLWNISPIIPDNSPTETFDVVLGSPNTLRRVTLDSDRTIQDLTIQGQSLLGDPSATLHVKGNMSFTSGYIGGPRVEVDGSFSTGSALSDIGENATLMLNAGSTANIQNLVLLGHLVQKGAATLSGTIHAFSNYPCEFDNEGVLTVNGNAEIGAKLNNTGTIHLQSGGLIVTGGGTNPGSFIVDAGTLLTFSTPAGRSVLYDPSGPSISGGGDILFAGNVTMGVNNFALGGTTQIAAIVNFNGVSPATAARVELNGGSLDGTADFHITSELIWRGGAMGGTGTSYIDAGANASSQSEFSLSAFLGRQLVNNGSINWGDFILQGTGTLVNNSTITTLGHTALPTLTNNPNALFIAQSDANQIQGSVTNLGLIQVQPGATLYISEQTVASQGSTVNTGTITVGAGALLRMGSFTSTNAATGLIAADHATITVEGAWKNLGTISLTDSHLSLQGTYATADIGTLQRDATSRVGIGGQMNNTGTTFEVTPATGSFDLESGTISGGLVHIAAGGRLAGTGVITGDVEAFGTLGIQSQLTIDGDLTLASSSLLEFDVAFYSFPGARLTEGGALPLQLDGSLSVDLDPSLAKDLKPSSTLPILTSNELLTGEFSNVPSGGRLTTADGLGSFLVTYSGSDSVVLTDFHTVPEPHTGTVFLCGALCSLCRFRKRSGLCLGDV